MLITSATTKSFEQVCVDMEAVVPKHQFGILGIHDLKATLNSKGVEFESECRMFEVCNPHQAKAVLETSMAISTAMPCRISVYPEDEKVILATMRPTEMMQMFDIEGAEAVAQEVEDALIAIMREVAGL